MQETIDVLLATYNGEKYIKEPNRQHIKPVL